MDTDDFLDFKELSQRIIKNRSKDDTGNTVQWLKVKQFQYSSEHQHIIKFKYTFGEEFHKLDVRQGVRGRKAAGVQQADIHLTKLLDLTLCLISLWQSTMICSICVILWQFRETIMGFMRGCVNRQ